MQAIFDSLERGAVLVTSTRRLARVLRQEFTSWQRDRGRSIWRTPAILPFDAYIASLWRESLARAVDDSILLTREQEMLLWEQIIRASPEGETLLEIEATARRAMDAWRLIHAYRLPLDGRYQAAADCEAFLQWARTFEMRSRAARWLDAARLPDRVSECMCAGTMARPSDAYYIGFDELSPQQREFLSTIQAREIEPRRRQGMTRTVVSPTAAEEIRCAAAWARNALGESPSARIGIVVPALLEFRSSIERIFLDVLGVPEAFHVSLGKPLGEYPIIHAALEIVRSALLDAIPLARIGMLLRSPFVPGAQEEAAARAKLDVRLRRICRREVSLDRVLELGSSDCPILAGLLESIQRVRKDTGAPREHAQWSRLFSDLLNAGGWPGERPPDSYEHQLLGRWAELLSEFAAFDVVSGPIPPTIAIDRLRALAGRSIFQIEDPGAPVQISDHIEIAGVEFDRMWVMGLHDEALPAAADPNPFLPISLQWERGMPHASAARQFEAAQTIFERLLSSAAEVVLSYPRMEADRALAPSPFLSGAPRQITAPPPAWIAKIRARSELETFTDETAPPLRNGNLQRGGAALLRDMAACPFRAFASYRLGATQPEQIEAGLSPRDKGKLLHQALQLIWGEIGSHDELRALDEAGLSSLLRRHVSAVIAPFAGTVNAEVESIRLERLLTGWMKLERSRPPFAVVQLEQKRPVRIGGLQLEVRADRVDELPDGRRMILDYKTGEVKSKAWTGERPDEPQLPLYCVSSDGHIAGAVFARIQAAGIGFMGIADAPLPEFKSLAGKNSPGLDSQFEDWRRALEQLARQFIAGEARVDPKYPGTCDYCAVVPLCRICDQP